MYVCMCVVAGFYYIQYVITVHWISTGPGLHMQFQVERVQVITTYMYFSWYGAEVNGNWDGWRSAGDAGHPHRYGMHSVHTEYTVL